MTSPFDRFTHSRERESVGIIWRRVVDRSQLFNVFHLIYDTLSWNYRLFSRSISFIPRWMHLFHLSASPLNKEWNFAQRSSCAAICSFLFLFFFFALLRLRFSSAVQWCVFVISHLCKALNFLYFHFLILLLHHETVATLHLLFLIILFLFFGYFAQNGNAWLKLLRSPRRYTHSLCSSMFQLFDVTWQVYCMFILRK